MKSSLGNSVMAVQWSVLMILLQSFWLFQDEHWEQIAATYCMAVFISSFEYVEKCRWSRVGSASVFMGKNHKHWYKPAQYAQQCTGLGYIATTQQFSPNTKQFYLLSCDTKKLQLKGRSDTGTRTMRSNTRSYCVNVNVCEPFLLETQFLHNRRGFHHHKL